MSREHFTIYDWKFNVNSIEIEGDIAFEKKWLCNISKTNCPILKLFSPSDSPTLVSA